MPNEAAVASGGLIGPNGEPAGGGQAGVGETAGDARQFVIFHVKDEMFAVPLAEVKEIIRMPAVVRMPLSPAALEGLANLRGTVLPVVNLRSVFSFEQVAHDDATRVVVLDQGHPVGLVVDRMANVVTVEANDIEAADTIQSTVDTKVVTGMIKGRDGSSMVMILDAANLIKHQFRDFGGKPGASNGSALDGHRTEEMTTARSVETSINETQLVSFEVAGQEYAFPIEEVQEIVQLPEQITDVPNTASHVLGVITLRNRLLPLVSLREMFGLPPAEATDANKVVVVSLGEGTATSVGVVMDSIKEVLRVGRSTIDVMPALLAQNRSLDDIQSICRLDDGRRLVSILSAGRLFNVNAVREIVGGAIEGSEAMANHGAPGAANDTAHDGANDAAGEIDDEEQFVVFRLMNEEYGVPIDSVQEIVRVPEELTRVPKTPAFIEGVINLRGSVLPVVDQRRRFGLAGIERNDRQRIMVFAVAGVQTGFIVDSVSEVMRIGARFIDGAPKLSAEQQKLIRRVANLEAKKRMILLLDVNQLLNVKELKALKAGEGLTEVAPAPGPGSCFAKMAP
jgi:purine-binding chemotaxis protein CheW